MAPTSTQGLEHVRARAPHYDTSTDGHGHPEARPICSSLPLALERGILTIGPRNALGACGGCVLSRRHRETTIAGGTGTGLCGAGGERPVGCSSCSLVARNDGGAVEILVLTDRARERPAALKLCVVAIAPRGAFGASGGRVLARRRRHSQYRCWCCRSRSRRIQTRTTRRWYLPFLEHTPSASSCRGTGLVRPSTRTSHSS